ERDPTLLAHLAEPGRDQVERHGDGLRPAHLPIGPCRSRKRQRLLSFASTTWMLVHMNENDVHDVAVIGAGAAGLSAALVLTRARRRVVVIDAGRPRNAPAAHMQGFLSRDGMPPPELLATGREEVTSYGGTIVADTVTSVGIHDDSAERHF